MAHIEADDSKADREAILGILEEGVNLVMALIDYARDEIEPDKVRKHAKKFGTKFIDFAESN
jgi:hypothetical protein